MKKYQVFLLSFLLIYFLNTDNAVATDPDDSFEQASPRVTTVHLPPHTSDAPSPRSAKEFEIWQQRYEKPLALDPDAAGVTPSEYSASFSKLTGQQHPLPQRGEVFLSSGPHHAPSASTSTDVSYVGPDHLNYLRFQRGEHPAYEVFCNPNVRSAKLSRKEPHYTQVYCISSGKLVSSRADRRSLRSDATELFFDAGHGIDHAKTITHRGSNSSWDHRNYTPQNAYYNRYIRKDLVGHATKNGFTYKELAIYGEKPLAIKVTINGTEVRQPVPQGFVFFLIDPEGQLSSAYYFSNFQHYRRDRDTWGATSPYWKFFAQRYRISSNVANLVWGHYTIKNRQDLRKAQRTSSSVGYRSLSGRFQVLPDNDLWDAKTRSALIRTASVCQLERAAEYDPSVEHMLDVARQFNDRSFVYLEFNGTLYLPGLAQYWSQRALGEVKRKSYAADDVFFLLDDQEYPNHVPLPKTEVSAVVSQFEKHLIRQPNTNDILRFMKYLHSIRSPRYEKWSKWLTRLVREERLLKSRSVRESTTEDLVPTISHVDATGVVLDLEMTQEHFQQLIIGFFRRSINEQTEHEESMRFLQISSISPRQLQVMLSSFQDGFMHNGSRIFVDVSDLTLKLPQYKASRVEKYIREVYPSIRRLAVID